MKKIFTLLFVAATATSAFGQGFSSISIEDASGVKALTDISIRGGASELQAVVPANFDLEHVVISATAATDSEILTSPLPTNFSVNNPQIISVKNASGTRNFQFTIRKLISGTLPFEFTAPTTATVDDWTTATEGWAHAGIDYNQAGVIRYGTITPTFIVGFTESPKDVTYDLQVVGAALTANDEFNVEASADGITWRTLKSFKEAGSIVQNPSWTNTKNDLQPTDRYVRWQYVKRTSNLNLNNIFVTKLDGEGISILQAVAPAFYQSAAGEITFTQQVAKAEVYSLLGGKTAEYNQPQGVVSIADGVKGVALVRVQLEDGSVITQKVVK